MTDVDTIAQLRRDVDVLTGLVVGLVSAAEMRAQTAVQNHEDAVEAGSVVMQAVTSTALTTLQGEVLRLEALNRLGLKADERLGYDALVARLSAALGAYAPGVEMAAAA